MHPLFSRFGPVHLLSLVAVLALFTLAFRGMSWRPGGKAIPVRPATVTISAAGFSPSSLSVPVRSTVCWINADAKDRWPSSHDAGSLNSFAFAPAAALQPGATWCFPFTAAGSWSYADRLRPGAKGSITVTAP
ncbi:MAG: hypothetical protein PHW10_04190 [Candidatus Peribacteraceae bacterium]|nr:hypothetical protein [Candidatus Peribacteraceae bacterium]